MPLLLRYGFTATLYVTTGWIADRDRPGSAGAAPARREQACSAGARSRRRPPRGSRSARTPSVIRNLTSCRPARSARSCAGSKNLLEDRLGAPVTGLSYPFGYSNRRVREAAVAAGYEYACAVANRLAATADERFALPRLTIGRATRLPGFAQIVRAERLPPEFLAYRLLTKGWSAVRHARSALNRKSSE